MIKDFMLRFENSKDNFKFRTSYYSKFKDKYFTNMHDRILMYYTQEFGYGNWEEVS